MMVCHVLFMLWFPKAVYVYKRSIFSFPRLSVGWCLCRSARTYVVHVIRFRIKSTQFLNYLTFLDSY